MKSAEQVKQFIGSGVGIVQIGITWGNEMTPDSQGCIRSFSGRGGGGHAVVFCGYVPDSDVGARSSTGWWLLLKNSWSKRWGKSGYAYVDPRACDQMIAHRWTSMYGRSDMDSPRPRPIKFDFTKQSILG
jgi:C1A family cysteine protease